LWRAVDQDSIVLDTLVQSRRDAGAAKRFFAHLCRHSIAPRLIRDETLGI
jgi:putative transposase